MKRRWTKEEAWEYWNKNPWMVGCNYVPSQTPGLSIWQEDTIEEILPSVRSELALMKEIGFNTVRMWLNFNLWYHEREVYLDRVDRILGILDEYGLKLMPVIFNDCVSFGKPADITIYKPHGKGKWDVGYHGGHKNSPHVVPVGKPIGWIRWDEEDQRPICEEYIRDLAKRFGKDERIVMWDLWNEPGNSKRGDMSIPYLKRAFEIAREEDVMQPLTAGVWTYPKNYGVDESLDVSPIQRVALDLSDIATFHNYEKIEDVWLIPSGSTEYSIIPFWNSFLFTMRKRSVQHTGDLLQVTLSTTSLGNGLRLQDPSLTIHVGSTIYSERITHLTTKRKLRSSKSFVRRNNYNKRKAECRTAFRFFVILLIIRLQSL